MSNNIELTKFLNEGEDWEKMNTNIPGIFIVKVPSYRNKQPPKLMIEVNPVTDGGKQMKRKGLYLSSLKDYLKFYDLLSDTEKMTSIMRIIEQINPNKIQDSYAQQTFVIE